MAASRSEHHVFAEPINCHESIKKLSTIALSTCFQTTITEEKEKKARKSDVKNTDNGLLDGLRKNIMILSAG